MSISFNLLLKTSIPLCSSHHLKSFLFHPPTKPLSNFTPTLSRRLSTTQNSPDIPPEILRAPPNDPPTPPDDLPGIISPPEFTPPPPITPVPSPGPKFPQPPMPSPPKPEIPVPPPDEFPRKPPNEVEPPGPVPLQIDPPLPPDVSPPPGVEF